MRAIAVGLLCALLTAGAIAREQTRFEPTAREPVAAVPGLEVVTLRDAAANACYTLFIMRPDIRAGIPAPTDAATLRELAGARDRTLAMLSEQFERGQYGGVPGNLGANPLRYQWEGDKVQSEYERRVRQEEFGRLEALLAQIAAEPRIAVAGPAPCAR